MLLKQQRHTTMKKLIGDKKFYLMVISVAVPIMIQNGVTNFVGMLDNIMVGRVGTEQMSGAAIVNQLMFVFNICIFGAISGAGIFGAQFFGNKNHEGVKNAMRFKIIVSALMVFIAMILFVFFGEELISLYLHESSEAGDIEMALQYGKQYLNIMIFGLVPFALMQVYASTLRETGETVMPMKAGITAVLINLVLNYLLIFGKFGFPELSVRGAAIATVISRFVECIYVVGWTHKHKERNKFIKGIYRNFTIPRNLTKQILIKGTPLIVNEALWAGGQAVLMQCYSLRGFEVIGAFNISSIISNIFNIVFLALGGSVSIIVGQLLGAGKVKEAKETDQKLIFFSVISCVLVGFLLASISSVFPRLYNTSDTIKNLAKHFIIVAAVFMPMHAFMHATYFTLRSGGKTFVTFLFDSVYVWTVNIPAAFILTRYTSLSITIVYIICQSVDILKCILGFVLVKKGNWIQNIVDE